MKKRLSMFLALCMALALLPVTALAAAELAATVTVGGVTLNAGNPYATTNAGGAVSLGGDEGTYNVKFDAATGTLTLRNANIKYESITANAISATGTLTIAAVGTNAVAASGNSAAIYITAGNLKLKGDGALTAVSNQTVAVYAPNITVRESITLTAAGGATTAGQPGGDGLYAFNDLKIKGTARVTAVGGKSPASSPFSAGIRAGASVAIEESATVTAVGGDTRLGGYSAGISVYSTGAITIGGSAKVVAVGGNAGTNASYGLYAYGAGGSITHTGGLLVAKGGKGATSLAMNQLLGGDTMDGIVITTEASAAANESKYCVVSPKTGDTADYRVVTAGVTSSTAEIPGHIEWGTNCLTLNNTIVIAPDVGEGVSAALSMQGMPVGATLTPGGFNVLLAGYALGFSAAVNGSGTYSDLTITGDGDLTAISVDGGQCYGIVNAKELSSTGTITAIGGGTGSNYGVSYSGNPLSISAGKVIAIAVGSGSTTSYGINKGSYGGSLSISGCSGVAVGRNSALSAAPILTGLVTMGAWNSKAMAWGSMPPPAAISAIPAADTATVDKTAEIQQSVNFTLTTYPAGTYKVYADGSTATEHGTVTAGLSGSTLTLTHATDIPAATYYISVTEPGKTESARLALTVNNPPELGTCHLTVNLNGGSGGTTSGDYTSGASVPIDAGTKAGYSFSGWTASLGSSPFADASSPSTTFTMLPNPVTITANWTYTGGSDSDGGSASNDNGSPVIVTLPASDKPNSPTQGEIKVPGTVDGKGSVTVSLTDKAVTNAFDKALAEARKNGAEQNGITVVFRVDAGSKTGSHVTVNLPKAVQDTILAKKIVSVIVALDNPDIRVGMDLAAVKKINRQAKSDVNITATPTDSGKLTAEARKVIGSRPVFDLEVNYGNSQAVSSFGAGSVSVTIPYTLGANEMAEKVRAVHVDSKGKAHWLVNSVYDSVEKVLHFSTSHFSTYGIGYRETNTAFADIAGHWATGDIEFASSRELFSGTSETQFSPNTPMTRGMFVTALGRLANADVSGYAKSSFSDVEDDACYMGYIEWASKNNIVNGVGNGRFAPGQSITREQMAVIMSNYAKTAGFTLPKVHIENIFADNAKISTYAKEAVERMQMAGVISGKNGNLYDAQGTATRAEGAAVLRRFVELAISGDRLQGWSMNDSGKWMYFQEGKPLTGKQDIDGAAYLFDQYGVTADVPKNLRYTTYTVQDGDGFWSISHKLGCPMSELERLNNKSRFSLILPGDVLRVPEK